MSQRAALLIGALTHSRKEWQACSAIASTLYEYPTGTRQDFIGKCKAGAFDGIHALYRSNDSNQYTGNFDDELLDALPKTLRFICHNGAGYDNIDVAACSKRGIAVSSTPIAVNDATADVAIFLMLGALRNITQSFQAVRQGASRPADGWVSHTKLMMRMQVNGAGTFPSGTTPRTRSSGSWAWAASGGRRRSEQRHSG